MDPNATLELLLLSLHDFQQNSSLSLNTVEETFQDLFDWLKKGGFPPDVEATIESVAHSIVGELK